MGLFGSTVNYAEIGHTSQAYQFKQTLKNVSGSRKKVLALCDGAIQAFDEGYPENIQILFQTLHKLDRKTSLDVLYNLIDSTNDTTTDAVKLAFAKTPEATRKNVLTNALIDIFNHDLNKSERFIETLLENGADANVEQNGFAGTLLAYAVAQNASPKILDLLSAHGADANGALNRAYSHPNTYGSTRINILKIYKEKQDKNAAEAKKNEGEENPAPEDDIQTTLKEIRENIRDLTAAVGILAERIDALQPAKEAPTKKTPDKPYPKL